MTEQNNAAPLDTDAVKVVIAYSPKKEEVGTTREVSRAVARQMVREGRARYEAAEPAEPRAAAEGEGAPSSAQVHADATNAGKGTGGKTAK